MGEGNEVVLAAVDLPLIDLGEERVMAFENGDFGGLHNGSAQVTAAALGHPAAADLLAAVELLDVEASSGDKLASAVLILGMKHRQDFGEDRGRPDRPESWNGLQEGLLLTPEVPHQQTDRPEFVGDRDHPVIPVSGSRRVSIVVIEGVIQFFGHSGKHAAIAGEEPITRPALCKGASVRQISVQSLIEVRVLRIVPAEFRLRRGQNMLNAIVESFLRLCPVRSVI